MKDIKTLSGKSKHENWSIIAIHINSVKNGNGGGGRISFVLTVINVMLGKPIRIQCAKTWLKNFHTPETYSGCLLLTVSLKYNK